MNKQEIAELKRRFTKDNATFQRLCGCYVDANKNKVLELNRSFLTLVDEELYKYLEIAKQSLSGKPKEKLRTLSFFEEEKETGGRQDLLVKLLNSELKNESLLECVYDRIIETYNHVGNYLILLYYDVYDVPVKTRDHRALDESEESYRYLLCAICPVDLSKPALGYRKDENIIASRLRDWVVGAPKNAFLFPAFTERSADMNETLYYTKNPKEPHEELMEVLGCKRVFTAEEKRKAFESAVEEAAEDQTKEVLAAVAEQLTEVDVPISKEQLKQTLAPILTEEVAEEVVSDFRENINCSDITADELVNKKKISQKTQTIRTLENRIKNMEQLLEESAEELENLYGKETELTTKIREELLSYYGE